MEAHRRVRIAARAKGISYRVEPQLPPDVLRVYKQVGQVADQITVLSEWADGYKRELASTEDLLKNQFGAELGQELQRIGFSLSGQYSDLRAGLFTLELDFNRASVTLWYGPKQEGLTQCSLSAKKITDYIEKLAVLHK